MRSRTRPDPVRDGWGPRPARLLPAAEALEVRRLLTVEGPWRTLASFPPFAEGSLPTVRVSAGQPFVADHEALDALLAAAPLEFTAAAAHPLEIALPMPDGRFERFAIVESPLMAPGLASRFPEIRSYRGQGIDDPTATARLSVSPDGFHGMILGESGTILMGPYEHRQPWLSISYDVADVAAGEPWTCLGLDAESAGELLGVALAAAGEAGVVPGAFGLPGVATSSHSGCGCALCASALVAAAGGGVTSTADAAGDLDAPHSGCGCTLCAGAAAVAAGVGVASTGGDFQPLRSGATLRTYRVAMAATGEFTLFNGSTVAGALAAINVLMGQVNLVYERDLAIRLTLVDDNDSIIFIDPGNDPYTDGDPEALLQENVRHLPIAIGDENYDVGHVLSTANSGLAFPGSAGIPILKAAGMSGMNGTGVDPFFFRVAHELGHQFRAYHTFNFISEQRNESTAYERGFGRSIMSYGHFGGGRVAQFHHESIREILDFVDGTIPGVGTRTGTGNTPPDVDAGATYFIPARTPFELTAVGSDADGDALTYSWEQRDLGLWQNPGMPDTGDGPWVRVAAASTSPTRSVPDIDSLRSGTIPDGESPFQVGRLTTFRVVVRDNRAGGGGVDWDDMALMVVDTGTPFALTSPTGVATWPIGSTQTVTWSVGGTQSAPIGVTHVNIRLSVDDGRTFPITLASATPNDGSQAIVVPAVPNTGQARIRVEAVGNIFFDISDGPFFIWDYQRPTAAIAPVVPNPRNTSVNSVQVAFSEPVTGVDVGDFRLTRNGSPVSLSLAGLSGGGASYTLDLSSVATGFTGAYQLTLVAAGSGIRDASLNLMATDASTSWVNDNFHPTATLLDVVPAARTTPVASVDLLFSEPVTGVDPGDFTLTRNGAPVSLAGVTIEGSGTFFAVSGLGPATSAAGAYVLTLVAAGSGIADAAGNALLGNASVAWSFDTTRPTADIIDVTPDPRNVPVESLAIVFSEAVTGFTLANLRITRDAVDLPTAGLFLSGSGANYTLGGLGAATAPDGFYQVVLFPQTGIADLAGNPMLGVPVESWRMDTVAPTAAIAAVSPDPRNTPVHEIDISFSEPVQGVSLGSFALTLDGVPVGLDGAILSGVPGGSSYRISNLAGLTHVGGDYVFTLSHPGSGVADLAGNPIAAPATTAWHLDNVIPLVQILPVAPDPRDTPVESITIVFTEPVVGFDLSDLALSRSGGANLLTAAQTLTTDDGITFTLGNLAALTAPGGVYTLSLFAATSGITDLVGNALGSIPAVRTETFTVQSTLVVSSVTASFPGLITINFNLPIDPVPLSLYDTAAGALGPPDVTLVGPGGPVRGSLVVAEDRLSVRFVPTGGPLATGSYTLALRSAANGFRTPGGQLLDGDADGSAGGDYTTTVNTGTGLRAVFLPDFARGPGQPVNIPATAAGLPVSISDGAGVTTIGTSIQYNPALLTITGAAPGPDAPAGATVTLNTSTPGVATIFYSGPTALPSGIARFVALTASVPATAPYASKQVLTLSPPGINFQFNQAVGDPAVHVIGYLGDASGNGSITGLDATLTNRIAASIDAGFAAYQLADPVLLADVNASGNITGLDATLINRFAASIPTPQIPPIPNLSLTSSGLDPRLSLPRGLLAAPGATLAVPVRVENTDRVPVPLEAFDLAIAIDPDAFDVRAVRADGHDLAWSFDPATGLLMITAARPDGPVTFRPGDSAELARIELAVRPGARAGARPLNLLGSTYAAGAPRATALNEGTLVLIPAPTNAADDPVDGQVLITPARQAQPAEPDPARGHGPWVVTPRVERDDPAPFRLRALAPLSRRGRGAR